jgi:transposase
LQPSCITAVLLSESGGEGLRGDDNQQEGIFSYISPEKRVPTEHPLRPIRKMVDEILKEMSPQLAKLYSGVGRPSIAPERLLRSLLLQIFYSVRSERMLIEQLQYNLLFRWFVGMEMDEEVWNHALFSKNRERLHCANPDDSGLHILM